MDLRSGVVEMKGFISTLAYYAMCYGPDWMYEKARDIYNWAEGPGN